MTLEEAIRHAEEKAEELQKRADDAYRGFCIMPNDTDSHDYAYCTECAEEHRQLAGWLRELLAYRQTDERVAPEDLYK